MENYSNSDKILIKEAFRYAESQLARRGEEVGGIDILAQQSANRLIRLLKDRAENKECGGELYKPKNLGEIKERAEKAAERFKKILCNN